MNNSFDEMSNNSSSKEQKSLPETMLSYVRKKYHFNEVFYSDISCKDENTKTGRFYFTNDGNKYPSITTVLSKSKSEKAEKSLAEWRNRVGQEESKNICVAASSRGTKLHAIAEEYILSKDEVFNTDNKLFYQIQPYLNRIDNIRLIETAIYSDRLKVAGRVDLIADFDGELSIIDFKTSTKKKSKLFIEDYFIQTCAYALMYGERFNEKVKNVVIMIAVEETGVPQLFVESPTVYIEKLVRRIRTYDSRLINE